VGAHIPKAQDLNATVGVCDRATQKAPKGYDKQTDGQTNFPCIIVRYKYVTD